MAKTRTFALRECYSSVHELGTKFYRVMVVVETSAEPRSSVEPVRAVIRHWGKVRRPAGGGLIALPVHHGQTKIEARFGSESALAREVESEKRKRGYRNWAREEIQKTVFGGDINDFFLQMSRVLDVSEITQLKSIFAISTDDRCLIEGRKDTGTFLPTKPKMKSEPEPDRGPRWGAW